MLIEKSIATGEDTVPFRRSAWRLLADDPKTLFGWWWSSVGGGNPAGLLFTVAFFVFLFSAFTRSSSAMISASFLFLTSSALARFGPHPKLETPALETPAGTTRTEAIYCGSNGRQIGRDIVDLSTIEGWLYAEGKRSTFALRPTDVEAIRWAADLGCTLDLIDGGAIQLTGLVTDEKADLEVWHQSAENPAGASVFPPARVHVQEFARQASWCMLSVVTFPLLAASNLLQVDRAVQGMILSTLSTFFLFATIATLIGLARLVHCNQQAKEEEARVEILGEGTEMLKTVMDR